MISSPGYGGDGTQHEIANAVVTAAVQAGTGTMGVLPGGTGNGFGHELGVPQAPAGRRALCTSTSTRAIDVGQLPVMGQAKVDDRYFVQRCYVGVEPEEQTSREMKDKYGVFAYAVSMASRGRKRTSTTGTGEVDDETAESRVTKVYLVNSGMMGTGPPHHPHLRHRRRAARLLRGRQARPGHDQFGIRAVPRHPDGRRPAALPAGGPLTLDVEPDQPVWTDGEYIGRTPIEVDVLPGALTVVVP